MAQAKLPVSPARLPAFGKREPTRTDNRNQEKPERAFKNRKKENPLKTGGFGKLRDLPSERSGGAEGSRTPDLDIANVALSQLSYGPVHGRRG